MTESTTLTDAEIEMTRANLVAIIHRTVNVSLLHLIPQVERIASQAKRANALEAEVERLQRMTPIAKVILSDDAVYSDYCKHNLGDYRITEDEKELDRMGNKILALKRELAAANAKLARFENAKMPEEPIPIGWISTSTFSWLSEDGAIGQAVFQPNRGGAYGGVAIFTGDQFNALRDFAARQSVDAELGAVVWRYIDRMKDIAPECGDGAERILNEFVAAAEAVIMKGSK